MPIKNIKPQHFFISYEVYPFHLLVSINEPINKVYAALKPRLPEATLNSFIETFPQANTYKAFTAMADTGQTVIYIPNFSFTPEAYGTLSHEIFHAVEFLFNRIELQHSIHTSSEAWAYMIGYITKKVFDKLK